MKFSIKHGAYLNDVKHFRRLAYNSIPSIKTDDRVLFWLSGTGVLSLYSDPKNTSGLSPLGFRLVHQILLRHQPSENAARHIQKKGFVGKLHSKNARKEVHCRLIHVPAKDDPQRHLVITADPSDLSVMLNDAIKLMKWNNDAARKFEYESKRNRSIARTDQLTKLCNRHGIPDIFDKLVKKSERKGQKVFVIMADADRFKKINDTHGHEAGDAALRHIAKIFQSVARLEDTVVRLGGEEIAILGCARGVDDANQLAERLRKKLESELLEYNGNTIAITASFGVAVANAQKTRMEFAKLVNNADQAAYAAKGAGRNCVMSYDNVTGQVVQPARPTRKSRRHTEECRA